MYLSEKDYIERKKSALIESGMAIVAYVPELLNGHRYIRVIFILIVAIYFYHIHYNLKNEE